MPRRQKSDSNGEHWRQLLQRSGVALVVSRGVEQEVELVNETFVRLFGYTRQDIPDVAHWWPLAYPDAEYRETVKCEWERRVADAVAKKSAIDPMEANARCKDGSERYIQFHFSSVGDSNVVSFIDLTERKRAEIALRESEERFRLMADTAPVLMWMSGTDKLCTYFNQSWLDFTGRSTEQELGNGWAEGVYSDDLQNCLDTYQRSFDRREKFRMEYRLRHHDGEYHWVLDIGVPRFNQDRSFAGYIGVVVDVTERKKTELVVRESEERLRLAAQLGGMFAYSWDAATDVIERSGESVQILGIRAEEVSTGGAVSAMVHPADKERLEAALANLTVENPTLRITYRIVRPDGLVKWLERNSRAYFDTKGNVERMVGMIVDITERKLTEQTLANMGRKLIEAQEQERARIGRELHDDINQRLGMLASELGTLQDNPAKIIGRVKELENKTIEIANDVQALSHELHASKLEYLGIVSGLRSWCKEFSQRLGLEIEFTSEVSSILPRDIGICLLRVLQEASHNAVKHSGAKRIRVQLIEDSNEVCLIIHDSGKGFDVTAAMRGHGLGLTSMHERVRLLNGIIAIQSKPGGGTTIHARIPFRAELDSERVAG